MAGPQTPHPEVTTLPWLGKDGSWGKDGLQRGVCALKQVSTGVTGQASHACPTPCDKNARRNERHPAWCAGPTQILAQPESLAHGLELLHPKRKGKDLDA